MEDTPQHIKDLQLKIWLSKTPAERLRIFLEDNEVLFKVWKHHDDIRKQKKAKGNRNQTE